MHKSCHTVSVLYHFYGSCTICFLVLQYNDHLQVILQLLATVAWAIQQLHPPSVYAIRLPLLLQNNIPTMKKATKNIKKNNHRRHFYKKLHNLSEYYQRNKQQCGACAPPKKQQKKAKNQKIVFARYFLRGACRTPSGRCFLFN